MTDKLISEVGFCGCGDPDSAVVFLRDLLQLIKDKKAYSDEVKAMLPTDGLYHLVLYMLNDKGLLEHGSSVGGSWITDKGDELLSEMNEYLSAQ